VAAPPSPEDSLRRRRLSGLSARPLNFTVRRRHLAWVPPVTQIRLATAFSYWMMLLWPLVLTGVVTVAGRRRLVKHGLFFCVGSLVCYGLMFLVGQLHAYWFIPLAASTPLDKLTATVTGAVLGMTVVAVVGSSVPLYFLYRGWSDLAQHVSPSNNRWRGP
jgi:hypothetical protein